MLAAEDSFPMIAAGHILDPELAMPQELSILRTDPFNWVLQNAAEVLHFAGGGRQPEGACLQVLQCLEKRVVIAWGLCARSYQFIGT